MYFHRVLLLLIPAVYMIIPLLIDSWTAMEPPWYAPYLLWLGIILLAVLIERKRDHV